MKLRLALGLLVWSLVAPSCAAPAVRSESVQTSTVDSGALLAPERLTRLRAYIHASWDALTRSERDLPRAAIDPKAAHLTGAPWPVYVVEGED